MTDDPITAGAPFELALFPLQTVLFPGGQMRLKVFEARYLDLMSQCLRSGASFGVVCLKQGAEVQAPPDDEGQVPRQATVSFEAMGVTVKLDEVDVQAAGIMQVQLHGLQRVALASPSRRSNGLWVAMATHVVDDAKLVPAEEHANTVSALAQTMDAMQAQGMLPYNLRHLDDAAWVGNRWSEILPIPLGAKQALMAMQDPLTRLSLVSQFLKDKGVIT
jgi:uncharacterized protein